MVNSSDLIQRDLRHVWHPCAEMNEFQSYAPLVVTHAEGDYIYTDKGPLIDAISSWWCKPIGHGHPAVIKALQKQLGLFEQVIAANTTHVNLVRLAELLSEITDLQHCFFASDGASAVEIALKMALQSQMIRGQTQRQKFLSLSNSYHGETLGALSVSDLGAFKRAYQALTFPCHFLENLPYVSGRHDPLWHNAEQHWQACLPWLDSLADELAAVIIEPVVQGAAGMRCYSANFLRRLGIWARSKGILVISDEIMTGLCRTGRWLAGDHAKLQADFVCLSKGLTAGSLPMSVVMISSAVYELFYSDPDHCQHFLHSHTHSANALAVAAALATLQVMMQENLNQKTSRLEEKLLSLMNEIADETGKLSNVRGIGGLVAADLKPRHGLRLDTALYQTAVEQGALLRPIGQTLYWFPPLTIEEETLVNLAKITLNSIHTLYSD